MNEPLEILQAYAQLLVRFSGAAGVSLYLPPILADEREILVHHGEVEPLPELADATAAEAWDAAHAATAAAGGGSVLQVASRGGDGVLLRVPARSSLFADGSAEAPARRRSDREPASGPAAWVGLRFAGEAAGAWPREAVWFTPPATLPRGEGWWERVLGLAAALAAHARMVTRLLVDPVSGLPGRAELAAQLDLARGQLDGGGPPFALLFANPDDFAAVNERIDTASGDLVLRQVAQRLRDSVRASDHVSRYGGAIFAVLLHGARPADTREVAAAIQRRLTETPYLSGAVRLSFSLGLATAGSDEPPADSHELLRRADQALCAARQTGPGEVCLWQPGSPAAAARSLDRLQGIFTGQTNRDYRNMGLLWDSVAIVTEAGDAAELARRIAAGLAARLRLRRATVLATSVEASFAGLAAWDRGRLAEAPTPTAAEEALAVRACAERHPVCERPPAAAGETPEASWAVPLALAEQAIGCIVLTGPAPGLAFDDWDLRFFAALASQVAVALDRSRLLGRERERQREERRHLESEVDQLRRAVQGARLAYRSAAMEGILAVARKVAPTDATVLITGESGTGKELVARTLHALSPRRDRPLVVVDCGAISPTLIESELFGHERGAFTGAHARRVGRLADADGGTVFLDEVGELPLDVQSKLLRFVQSRELTPVGGTRPRLVDVRLIAATNADLRGRAAAGTFRADLYHRLNVVPLRLPPLRERREDIPLLADLFLREYAASYGRPGLGLAPGALALLERHSWPGNVRELQNRMLQAILLAAGQQVEPLYFPGLPRGAAASPAAPPDTQGLPQAGAPPPEGPAAALRDALGRELDLLAAAGGPQPPLGKWLLADLIAAADSLAHGVTRRGAELLGVAESTYRRQLRHAAERRGAEPVARTPTWPAVLATLSGFILGRPPGSDATEWAEGCLLAEILARGAGEDRRGAALLGVTEPTFLRRLVRHRARHPGSPP